MFIDESAPARRVPTLAALLSEARNFGASITAATQYTSQLRSQLRDHLAGVLTNAQRTLVGRLPPQEAVSIRSRLGEEAVTALPTLPRHHLIIAMEDTNPARPR